MNIECWFADSGEWIATQECEEQILYLWHFLRIGSLLSTEKDFLVTEVIGPDFRKLSKLEKFPEELSSVIKHFNSNNLVEVGVRLLEKKEGVGESQCTYANCLNKAMKNRHICAKHYLIQ